MNRKLKKDEKGWKGCKIFQAFQAAAATVAGKLAIQLPPPGIDRSERSKQTEIEVLRIPVTKLKKLSGKAVN